MTADFLVLFAVSVGAAFMLGYRWGKYAQRCDDRWTNVSLGDLPRWRQIQYLLVIRDWPKAASLSLRTLCGK